MNKSKIKYCLGIDGGGTKTEFLLTDIHSAEIKRLVLGSSNPVNEGLDAAKAILKEGIHGLLSIQEKNGTEPAFTNTYLSKTHSHSFLL